MHCDDKRTLFVLKQGIEETWEELKKNDNITVKEWRSRMETLKKEHKTKMQGLDTDSTLKNLIHMYKGA